MHIPRSVPPSTMEPERPPIPLNPPPPAAAEAKRSKMKIGLPKLNMATYKPDERTLLETLLGKEAADALTRSS